jgi:predicted metal-binding membrane protein
MRYVCAVTDAIQPQALTQLAAAEVRLAAILVRPKLVAVASLATLTALGWIALALMVGEAGLAALCRAQPAGSVLDMALLWPMWAAMVLAMMLPTAGPMILTYAEIADTALQRHEPVASPLFLAAGYALVWFGFSLVAAMAQWALARTGLFAVDRVAGALAGAFMIGAGVYQFSTLKHACLSQCQRPFPFFFANWTNVRGGVFRLGLRQGLYCLGCCWALMLLMLAVGGMNAVWMAGLGVAMLVEKMATTTRVSRALGCGLIVAGLAAVVAM